MEINPNLSDNARNDLALVKAACSGDDKAFARLLMRYKDFIYLMLYRLLKNKLDAKELTIEAFGKAFTNIHQYQPQFAFSTWLSSIAFNNAIDYLRKKRVITVPLESSYDGNKNFGRDYIYNVQTSSDNPEEAFIREQNAIILGKSVSSLKPQYRTLLEMRYFKDYSYREIARELNLPLETVKVQLFRSRIKLFDLLKDSEINC